jgi:hypothetical protein
MELEGIFIKDNMLKHLKQSNRWGCMYYSAFAITGDKRWLEYQTNIAPFAFLGHAGRLGYVLRSIYVDPLGYSGIEKYSVEPSFWGSVKASLTDPTEYAPMLITVGELEEGLMHQVAIALTQDFVLVSDSALESTIEFTYEAFLESKYSRAIEINVLMTFDEAIGYEVNGQEYFAKQHLDRLEQNDTNLEMLEEFA